MQSTIKLDVEKNAKALQEKDIYQAPTKVVDWIFCTIQIILDEQ